MTDARMAVKFAALALAYRAKCGPVGRAEVGQLEASAKALGPTDLIRLAVEAFAATWWAERRDGEAMFRAGDVLIRDVERATWPEPVRGAA